MKSIIGTLVIFLIAAGTVAGCASTPYPSTDTIGMQKQKESKYPRGP